MTEVQPCVFIVDDDEVIRTSLSRALIARGMTVQAFTSADAFLRAYDDDKPGCLVLDYGMPHMTGLELQQLLAAQGRTIPIIFITGHGGVPESVQAIKRGAIDFLEKPFRQDTLLDRIRIAFQKDAQAREARKVIDAARVKFDRLTDREQEIAEFVVLIPATTSSKDVARALDISPRTVDHHRARILEKMEVKSVVALVDLCRSTGILGSVADRGGILR